MRNGMIIPGTLLAALCIFALLDRSLYSLDVDGARSTTVQTGAGDKETAQKASQPLRKTIFSDDFASGRLDNWQREQHAPDGYPDFVVRNGSLTMLDAGNRIRPITPDLKTFLLKGGFETDWACNGNAFSLQIHSAYDRHRRQGTTLDISSNGKELAVSLCRGGQLLAKEKLAHGIFDNIVRTRFVKFEVEAKEGAISLLVNSERCFSHAIPSEAGAIALSRGAFVGELRIKFLEIATEDELVRQVIWDRLKIPFAPINGMDNPIVWTITACRIGSITQLDVELSGGVKDRENLDWFPYHGRYVDQLESPYLRIESPGRNVEYTLTEKTLTLCNPPTNHFYALGYERPQWPLRNRFFIDSLDCGNVVMFCGYKAYSNRATNQHQAAGPSETAYDGKSGKIVYYGQAIGPGAVVIDLKSSDQKQICKDIPKSTHEYEKALQFARENHYFSDEEECSFHLELFSRMGAANAELRAQYRLQNAFFEPMGDYRSVRLEDASEKIVLDIERLRSEAIRLGKLKAGIYHLGFRLYQGNRLLQDKYRAFEVSSKEIGGPQASKLPKLFSAATETMGSDTDYFDPWKPDCVDVSHYMSIGASIMPHFAREKRVWELYNLYHREWLLWLTSRTAKDWDMSRNRDLVEQCDYLVSENELQQVCLVRLCCRAFYQGSVLRVFYDFAQKNNFHPARIKALMDKNTIPDRDTFNELVEKHFYPWIDFFCDRFLEAARQKKGQIAAINGQAGYSFYGPVAIYAGSYKTAHSARYVTALKQSQEIKDLYNGMFIFEDYPHACRYSINRGPFLLAGINMSYPGLKLYPEMYCPDGNVCPDAAVARAWPTAGIWGGDHFPVGSSVKRAMEYVYATAWHNGRNFDYWRDYGFHTRIWERERYEALLKAWAFVDKVKPRRPLKANAFICNEACCENHPVCYDEYPGDGHEVYGDLFNTAEESIAYAYEMSRNAGQNAGFVADFKSLANLNAQDIDTLVLPPLTKVSKSDLARIRQLHEEGVSLLAFEEIGGLEDLFGVKPGDEKRVNHIAVNKTLANNPLLKLADFAEYTEHRACKGKYSSAGADVLLDGETPVLFTHRTRWGRTALFNVPPTVVRRQDQFHRVCYGRDSISRLINESTQLVLKYLSRPAVESDAGKLIAFKDTEGATHIIIEEDAHPMPSTTIHPLLRMNQPGLTPDRISCTREYSVVSMTGDTAQIRLKLSPDELAIISIRE